MKKTILSTLWIFVLLNFIYADISAMHDSAYLKGLLAGEVEGVVFTPGFLLGASIFMEISIAMVLLARVAKYKLNRWANIIAGALVAIAQFSTLFIGSTPSPSYLFYTTVEVAALLFIVWYAWKWPKDETA